MQQSASAPGKLMLLGDHAVVYERPCLVTAVDIRYQATVTKTSDSIIEIMTPALAAQGERYTVDRSEIGRLGRPEATFVEAVIARVLRSFDIEGGLKVETDGPTISYGLGSSSAITVATAEALNGLFGLGLDKRALFDICYHAVLDVQGAGSGFDVAAAIYGGTLYFQTGGAVIEPLNPESLPFIIGYSGEKVGTVSLVAGVADLRRRIPAVMDAVFDLSRQIVEDGRGYLLTRDWRRLGDVMNVHQGLLAGMGVSAPQLSRLIFAARDAGALGAKLSGAGGGDCMFALVNSENRADVVAAIESAGGQVLDLAMNTEGVRLEHA
jgi:mevalonate kinase